MNDNVATVSAIYEAFGTGDVPSVLRYLADNVRFEEWADNSAQKAGVPWFQLFVGKDEVLQFFKIVGGFRITDFRVPSLMAGENQVAAEIETEADVLSTGGHYLDQEIHLWT